MLIGELATHLATINEEIDELEIDIFADNKNLKEKEQKRRKILNELIFYDEFEELYRANEKYEFNSLLLYPFKQIVNENGDKEFVAKSSEEYKEDVLAYIEEIEQAYEEEKIDKKTYNVLKKEANELYQKQMEKIEKEEKEKEKQMDIREEYQKILTSIEDTKKAFIYNQIGEESYSSLQYKYKNMQEVDKRILLEKTHIGLCKEMGISCDLDFTKYDFKTEKTVSKDGYCIKIKDLNQNPYPLDTILLEQSFKLHMKELLNNLAYTPSQKEKISKLLYNSLEEQKKLVFMNAKKKELKPEGY